MISKVRTCPNCGADLPHSVDEDFIPEEGAPTKCHKMSWREFGDFLECDEVADVFYEDKATRKVNNKGLAPGDIAVAKLIRSYLYYELNTNIPEKDLYRLGFDLFMALQGGNDS